MPGHLVLAVVQRKRTISVQYNRNNINRGDPSGDKISKSSVEYEVRAVSTNASLTHLKHLDEETVCSKRA